MSDEKVLLNIEEVSEMLGVTSRHVRRLWQKMEFPQPIRLGGSVRWNRHVVDRFLQLLSLGADSCNAARDCARGNPLEEKDGDA